MDSLPVELLRLIFAYCDPRSVRDLREVNRALSNVGYEYLVPPRFAALGYRDDIDRLSNISRHPQLRGSIESIVFNFADVDDGYAKNTTESQHFYQLPGVRQKSVIGAMGERPKMAARRTMLNSFDSRAGDLGTAFAGLPNLTSVEVTFTKCPSDNTFMQGVYGDPDRRKMDRHSAHLKLNAIIAALDRVPLSSFSVDRFPLEVFKVQQYRKHWFTHAQSFESLTRLHLTLDPGGSQPASANRAVNGLCFILQIPKQLRSLKLAFHAYSTEDTKFAVSFRELLNGFTYPRLTDLMLDGISCEEEDLKEFLARHGSTLTRLRLGGSGLAQPHQASKGGIQLYDGTFKSLFTKLRPKLPNLERFHMEGSCDCQLQTLSSHETYNFYPLTNENWEEVPRPGWARDSHKVISCEPFERFLLTGGPYPGNYLMQHNY